METQTKKPHTFTNPSSQLLLDQIVQNVMEPKPTIAQETKESEWLQLVPMVKACQISLGLDTMSSVKPPLMTEKLLSTTQNSTISD